MTPERLSAPLGRYIKKLGNPAAILDDRGRIWRIFVGVSAVGWAGSSAHYLISDDGGETWGSVHRPETIPFFNVSAFVTGMLVPMAKGGLTSPVYHEFTGKFAELLALDSQSVIRTKKCLTVGGVREALQPSPAAATPKKADLFMRYAGEDPKTVLFASTHP